MGGIEVKANEVTGNIKIENVIGDIEITATRGLGNCLVRNGVLLNKNYLLGNVREGVSMIEKNGYVECSLEAVNNNYRSYIELEYYF